MPWSLLLNRWALVALLLAGVAAWGGYEKLRADNCQVASAAKDVQIGALGEDLHRQNDAVARLAREGAEARQRGATARAAATAVAQSHQAQIAALQAAVAAPAPAGKSCADATAKIRELL